MKTYTEEDLRNAFQAGTSYGQSYVSGMGDYPDMDEYIESLSAEEPEETMPFTFMHLNNKIDWDILSDLIGVDYYKKELVDARQIFEIKMSDCKKYGLI